MIYIFSFLMICSLTFLIIFKKKENYPYILFFKTASSLIFLSAGVYYSIRYSIDETYALIIILGLLFGLIGDILLVYIENKKFFIYGLVSFLTGHLFYVYAFILKTNFKVNDIYIFIILIIFCANFFYLFKIKLHDLKYYVYLYTVVIAIMLSKAISFVYNDFNISNILPLLIGTVLFTISDMILSYTKFKKYSDFLSSINLLFYYSGQLLIAYSLINF